MLQQGASRSDYCQIMAEKTCKTTPLSAILNTLTVYRASSDLSSIVSSDTWFLARLFRHGSMKDFAVSIIENWCGRGDLNSHGLGPTDFKSVMSTIPSRPLKRQKRCPKRARRLSWQQPDSLTVAVTQKKLTNISQIFFSPATFCRWVGLIAGHLP